MRKRGMKLRCYGFYLQVGCYDGKDIRNECLQLCLHVLSRLFICTYIVLFGMVERIQNQNPTCNPVP
jgi:hypothetical protein